MSTSNHVRETTFASYTSAQAKHYVEARGTYSTALFQTVFEYHAATGGEFQRVMDVGCGPGNATRMVAKSFDEAVGVDAGESMIQTARDIGGSTRNGSPITYSVTNAEDIGEFKPESVDMVTCATSAHWFDMERFWPAVAKILKPSGTVALWTISALYCHPSTPNADAVQNVLLKFQHERLRPYRQRGHVINAEGYGSLLLPWSMSSSGTMFDQSSLKYSEWNKDGKLGIDEQFFGGQRELSLEEVGKGLASSSAVTKWREAHPQLAHTDQDCVVETLAEIKDLLPSGINTMLCGTSTTLVLFKKVAAS